jgi:hypothetical protein
MEITQRDTPYSKRLRQEAAWITILKTGKTPIIPISFAGSFY